LDKDTILTAARLLKFNRQVPPDLFGAVITEYLREVAPEDTWDKIPSFITAALASGRIEPYYSHAINHFCSKFNVIEAYSKPDEFGRIHLLSIY
jgi:hypothetical protein